MADYSFEDAAKPYLEWVERWKKENKGLTYSQLVKELVMHAADADRFFGFKKGTEVSVNDRLIVIRFPESPVHLTIPRDPKAEGIEESRHFTVHVSDESSDGRFRYRNYYRFEDLKSVGRDNPGNRPIGETKSVGLSARERYKQSGQTLRGMPLSALNKPKGGRRTRRRRRRTVRSK